MLVSPLARPNGQEDIIPQTFRALQEVFGPNNFRAVLFSGNPEDIKDQQEHIFACRTKVFEI